MEKIKIIMNFKFQEYENYFTVTERNSIALDDRNIRNHDRGFVWK